MICHFISEFKKSVNAQLSLTGYYFSRIRFDFYIFNLAPFQLKGKYEEILKCDIFNTKILTLLTITFYITLFSILFTS